jgi:hypothetical protein
MLFGYGLAFHALQELGQVPDLLQSGYFSIRQVLCAILEVQWTGPQDPIHQPMQQ